MDTGDLSGKVVLITGAGKGIGKVIARRFAERGAHVLINFFHSLDEAKRTKLELEASGARVDLLRASVAVRPQVDKMFEEIKRRFGRLDVLVNNAASGALVPYAEITEEHLDRAFDTNLKGSFWCAQQAAPLMAANGGGSIINMSTLGGEKLVMANYLACGVAKAAVEALTRYLANELAGSNIRVNTAAAGMIESEVANLFPDATAMHREVRKATPFGRLATPEEFADVILFLASPQSRWITGQTLLADGGLSLGSALLSPPVDRDRQSSARDVPAPAPDQASEPLHEATDDGAAMADVADVAIVGMGLAVPGASDPEAYWKILLEGADAFKPVPTDRWDNRSFHAREKSAEDKTYSEKSAFITDFVSVAGADQIPGHAGSPEYSTLWLRHALLQALAGVKRRETDRYSFSVGYTADGSQHLEEAMVLSGALSRLERAFEGADVPVEARAGLRAEVRRALERRYPRGLGNTLDFLPHRVGTNAMRGVLPAGTEVQMVDTACSSSLYTIDIGIKGLQLGKHDIALCGGSFALSPRGFVLFAKLNGLSVKGEVRALDNDGDGVLFADGAGVVALKRLDRALADGDRILGVARAFGSSSDGKGKAIYAPSSTGQALAIQRAFEGSAGSSPSKGDVDLVVAHATGTPAGDLAEFTTLREFFTAGQKVHVTSNKSVIGHTGWAAGTLSVIEVLLSLQHNLIPPQHRFSGPPPSFQVDKGSLVIPTKAIPWSPRPDRPRIASVSGFGFGGTNAHLIIEEYRSGSTRPRPAIKPRPRRLGIVAWAAHAPGGGSEADVRALCAGQPRVQSFGDLYPTPPFQRVRLPPSTVRTIDRTQLMILECAHQLRDQLGPFWEASRAKTGVFLGHMGATRNATLYGARCYLDDIRAALAANPLLADSPFLAPLLERLTVDVRGLLPPSNEDSFPGSMPNLIPARVANYFGLNGLNMTLDTGFSSTFTAFDIASRYLASGELDMALVGGINGNITPEMRQLLAPLPHAGSALWSEIAVLFALVDEAAAERAGLQVLAWFDGVSPSDGLSVSTGRVFRCGAPASAPRANYLGAEGVLEILQALSSPDETAVVCETETGQSRTITLAPVAARTQTSTQPIGLPAQFEDPREWAPGQPLAVQRYAVKYAEAAAHEIAPQIPFLPEGTLVLTDQPSLLKDLALPPGTVVLSTSPLERRAGHHHAAELTDVAVAKLLAPESRLAHLRVVSRLDAAPGQDAPESLLALHTLTFLCLKHLFTDLQQRRGSVIGAFGDAFPGGHLHPHLGLFGGLFKCAALELPNSLCFALFTDAREMRALASAAERESRARRHLPVVLHQGDRRLVPSVVPEPGTLSAEPDSWLAREAVIVAVGGSRGITAEILKTVCQHFKPRVHVLGSNAIDRCPAAVQAMSDEEFQAYKPIFLRNGKQATPDKPVASLISEFNRLAEARLASRNLAELARHCGADRVHYHRCSILDGARVSEVIGNILAQEGRVDLLINAAGLNKSAPIATKSLADFLSIRDIKVRGYHNLKRAFGTRRPRLWCNFGSLLGMTGQLGEADYASANDFLSTSALAQPASGGPGEITIGWTLWGSIGLGANGLTKAYFEKSGTYSNMATEEGIHHFMRELHLVGPAPSTVHLGSAERRAVERLIPGLMPPAVTSRAPVELSQVPFYCRTPALRSDSEVTFERTFDLTTDAYLMHHRVNGHPTLPGTFLTEIAAEAAGQLVPDLRLVAFEDVSFQHFLRVYPDSRSNIKTIKARVVSRDADRARVHVAVLTDVVAPNGRKLVKDKVHFEIDCVLARDFSTAPLWEEWGATDQESVPDPYHMPEAPVLLTGPFVTTTNTRLHALGKRADLNLRIDGGDAVFRRFSMPSLLLDGLARVGVLGTVHQDFLPLAAPASVRRIDLYEAGNDLDLWQRHGALALHATPRVFNMASDRGTNRLVAVRADGRIVLEIHDIHATVIGYLHRKTGAFHVPADVESRPRSDLPQMATH
jgi:NAD(P)-dependent dehydrogenase (short-subunit alcohol dehydrogenase family)/3-oxoacyl-(acyl-carrier-protein) synthase